MAMATVTNSKGQGVKIALAKAQRAYEIMQAFRRASVNQKNKWYEIDKERKRVPVWRFR